LAVYAALELIEGIGLSRLQRWGEYFAVVATSILLPLEVRDLLAGITLTLAGALIINVAARAENEPAADKPAAPPRAGSHRS